MEQMVNSNFLLEDRLLNVKVWREFNKDNPWVEMMSSIWIRQLERDLSLKKIGLTDKQQRRSK
jgi:hypothetical protein